MERRFPSASVVATPRSARSSFAAADGAANLCTIDRIVVPDIEPLIPILPNSPTIAAVSSMVIEAARAIGATYFRLSPSMSSVTFDRVKVAVSKSATRGKSEAERPNPDTRSVAMSDVFPNSVMLAVERSRSDGRATNISSTDQPVIAIYSRPCADLYRTKSSRRGALAGGGGEAVLIFLGGARDRMHLCHLFLETGCCLYRPGDHALRLSGSAHRERLSLASSGRRM